MTEQYVKTATELKEYFFNVRTRETDLTNGIMIRTGIRRDTLTDIDQGKIILNGSVKRIAFESMGGGVYRAYIKAL